MSGVTRGEKNILIVDDDELVAEFISALLMHAGYRSTIADSAENALIGFAETGYDLVLTDIFMDGMGGIEGVKKMRAQAPDIPIVAMSAGYKEMEPEKALKAAKKIGAVGALAKLIDPDNLVAVLEVLLSRT